MGIYDTARRRQSVRRGRERGCWVYVPMEELERAGVASNDPPPFYRVRGFKRSRNGCTAIVSLYREP